MTVKKTEPKNAPRDPKAITLDSNIEKTKAEKMAISSHDPTLLAGVAGGRFREILVPGADITQSVQTLRERVKKVQSGDLRSVEKTLVAQADTLDGVFNAMLSRAIDNQANAGHFEMFMRVALKAQAQCRTTFETLAEIKNPQPTTFVKQQNVGAVQQVNNTLTHAQGIENRPNELSERREHVEVLDPGTTDAAIEAHPRMEAMAEIHRTEDTRGKKAVIEKCVQGER